MAQAYRRRSPVIFWPVKVKFMVNKMAMGQV